MAIWILFKTRGGFIASVFICLSFRSDCQTSLSDTILHSVQKKFQPSKHSFLHFGFLSKKIHASPAYDNKAKFPVFSNRSFQNKMIYGKHGFFPTSSSISYSPIPETYFINREIDPISVKPEVFPKPLLRNEKSSFWRKAGRGELIIGGFELIGMAGLMMMPKEVTKWDPDWMADAKRSIIEAFTSPPIWDKDDWAFNYVGHPIAGSYYYNAVRSQNATWWESFLFSTFQSCVWEYIIEGSAERPSIQDLIVTPIGGVIIGEPIHILTMNMRKNGFRFMEKVFVLLFNPTFVLNNGFGPRHNPVRIK